MPQITMTDASVLFLPGFASLRESLLSGTLGKDMDLLLGRQKCP